MIGKILSKRYRIEALIGSGGMAVVYRALDLRTNRTVAVKALRAEYSRDQDFLRRFDREAMACAKVQHPNIVNLLDIGEDGDTRYLVMEYVQGQTLKEVIQERGKLPQEEALRITQQALSALGHAHQKHIIHRDIKPQNMLVGLHGDIKIADFGIARMTDSTTLTHMDGNIMGSVHYFSPEQAKGQQASAPSDLYSIGVVLYEMLTGRVPFDGETSVAVAMQHVNELPKPVSSFTPGVYPAVEQVLAKAMCKGIAQRYTSAEQMSADLRRAVRQPEGGFVKMRPAPVPADTKRTGVGGGQGRGRNNRARRWRGRVLFTLTLLLCAGVLGLLGYAGYGFYAHMTNYTAMPGVTGLEQSVALDVLRKAQIEPVIIKQRHDVVMSGFVITQDPPEGKEIGRGEQAALYISVGSAKVQVPNLVGMAQEEAEAALTEQGLAVGDVLVELSEALPGRVIRQEPAASTEATDGMMVDLHVSGGVVVVPDLSQLPFADAEGKLTSLGLAVGHVTFVDVDNARQDTQIQAQDPKTGERVFPGSEIALSVARFDHRPFHKQVSVRVEIPKEGARVRVALVERDGKETEQYAARHALAGPNELTVELRSAIGGEASYRVYVNDAVVEESVITFE